MKMRWIIVLLPVVSVLAISLAVKEHAARAASPQATAPISAPHAASITPVSTSVGALAIPDTPSAINSPTPMSQRVVHYEIDARYDATKHTVDPTQVLTCPNPTGQAHAHFPYNPH